MDFVSLHIKVHGDPNAVARSWTRKLKDYLELMQPASTDNIFYFHRKDHRGEISIGKHTGPDGQPIIKIDGPHSAPAEHYDSYNTVMLVGAGIGLTPCAAILTALLKYRWRKNFNPNVVRFYWLIRHSEVSSFQWFVRLLTELCYDLKKGRETNQISGNYSCEIHIYVTAVPKNESEQRSTSFNSNKSEIGEEVIYKLTTDGSVLTKCDASFNAAELYDHLLSPRETSDKQIEKMKIPDAQNRLQNIWTWSGRPKWDDIFQEVKTTREHSDIGVVFCGSPAIGGDLKKMCEKYSNVEEDCIFSLNKENF